jgi:hypothetical protein
MNAEGWPSHETHAIHDHDAKTEVLEEALSPKIQTGMIQAFCTSDNDMSHSTDPLSLPVVATSAIKSHMPTPHTHRPYPGD